MPNSKVTTAKVRNGNKGAQKAEQGKVNGNGAKVRFGKKFLKKWNLNDKPSSDKFGRFKTYAFMKQYLEDAIASGKGLKELASEFKVTSARIYECTKQLGMNLSELKGRAKRTEGE